MQDTPSKFNYVTLPQLNYTLVAQGTENGRVYTTPDGKTYPSASTITRSLNREAIAAWRARVGVVAADKKTKRGADRGNLVHLVCEKYLLGKLSPMERAGMMPTTKELFLQVQKKLDKHIKTIYAIEQPLYSDRLKIAGRADGIVGWEEGKEEPSILDFKTSEKPKPKEWIINYFVQCAAYAEMFEERTGIPINKLVVAMAVETELDSVIYVEDKAKYIPILQECIDIYYKENPM